MFAASATEMSQVVPTPASAEPTMLPTAPTARASRIEATPMPTAQSALARITRPRCGTSVNVVRPLRWLHSLVTDSTATMGRITVIGMPTAAPKVE